MATFNDGPEAQAKLAETLRRAMNEQGFFTLINYGISEEESQRQVDIGYVSVHRSLPNVPDEYLTDDLAEDPFGGEETLASAHAGNGVLQGVQAERVLRVRSLCGASENYGSDKIAGLAGESKTRSSSSTGSAT